MLRQTNGVNVMIKWLATNGRPTLMASITAADCRGLCGKCTASDETVDRVSPVGHSVSNLRFTDWAKPVNETPVERQLRLKRVELQNWNHEYWLKNNTEFQRQKQDFIKRELKTSDGQEFKSSLSYDELSLFYKSFLDSNHRKHMNYNL
ncbi:unnamed protein product [Medioppia subpectinata]|uniref:Uncharacterized protein n=1 Tax=Medioppia subpectinata TaxID=1979941 RepID=A0A7R9KZZ2_9ACAR|nr:unnamed protein product [Medioppia subpectinata]CAG2113052.1 unnamed protein product [Medioppia subpectinata]